MKLTVKSHPASKTINITIDGTAASGKSTIANMLANTLGLNLLPTGYFYRALTYLILNNNIEPKKCTPQILMEKFKNTEIKIENNKTLINDNDITNFLNSKEIEENVSLLSSNSEIKKHLNLFFQEIIKKGGWVIEGRDAGCFICPQANFKFFLTVDEKIALKRKMNIVETSNQKSLLQELILRDKKDRLKSYGHLSAPLDAIVINTSYLSPNQVLKIILFYIQQKS